MSISPTDRVLVTGGTGFIGRYVVDRLVSGGHRPFVTQLGDVPSGFHGVADVELVELDLRDEPGTERLVSKVDPTIVIHLAGITDRGEVESKLCEEINHRATCRLLDSLAARSMPRVIMIGTAAEYGRQPVPFFESAGVDPRSAYSLSRSMANRYALGLSESGKLSTTVLRLFSVYGVGQPRDRFLSQLIERAVRNVEFGMSDGVQRRDFVHVWDVADAIITAAFSPTATGRTINIGGGTGHRLADVARAVWQHCGAEPDLLKLGAIPKRGDDAYDTIADISLAADVLSWFPSVPFINDDGLGIGLVEMIEAEEKTASRDA